jgi:hypothetical protein
MTGSANEFAPARRAGRVDGRPCHNRSVKAAIALATAMCLAPALLADQRHVVSDDKVDFPGLKTFSIRAGAAKTTRPELNNALILKKVEDAIRVQLSAKGLTEAVDRPDMMVGFMIGGDRPNGPSVVFDRGTLVIDMTARESNRMIWQGVYTDDKSTPAKVAGKLPEMVQKLLSEYPPKKKK